MENENSVKVISFANQKGGVGKSTLTVMTANYLANKNYRVLVIDADYQGSILQLRKQDKAELGEEHRFPYDVVYCPAVHLDEKLDEMADDYDVIFVDMPGQSYGEGLSKLLTLLDYAFIPVKTGDTDVFSSVDFMENIFTASSIRKQCGLEEIKYNVVINEAEIKTNRFRDLVEFIESKGYNFDEELVVKKKVSIKDLSNTFMSPLEDKDGKDLEKFFKRVEMCLELN